MKPNPKMVQSVILTLTSGRKLVYTGPAQVNHNDSNKGNGVRDILVTVPRALPKGQSWEQVTVGEMSKQIEP